MTRRRTLVSELQGLELRTGTAPDLACIGPVGDQPGRKLPGETMAGPSPPPRMAVTRPADNARCRAA